MFNYDLTNKFSWEYLPWKQINERIFILQDKIHKASKECNQKDLRYYQSILINSIEVKLQAIEYIDKLIQKYYLEHNYKRYRLYNVDKHKILLSLLGKIKSNKKYLIDKIKQYIIYVSIKSDWEAKLEPCILSQSIKSINKPLKLCIKQNNNSISFNLLTFSSCIKHINMKYLILKMQSLLHINSSIKEWVGTRSILEPLNLNYMYQYSSDYYSLYRYINYIILNGIEWFHLTKVFNYINEHKKILECKLYIFKMNIYIFSHSTKYVENLLIDYIFLSNAISLIIKSKKVNFSYSKYINKHQIFLIKSYIKRVKLDLYHKDTLGRLRSNKHLNTFGVAYKLKHDFEIFYKNHGKFFDIADTIYLCKTIETIFFYWLNKKYKSKKYIKPFLNLRNIL
uniref:Reverse transcriptase N-terminal domain-containing protein n=1 Tax=Pterocladia lucida TaxID=31408 RepID=A0A6M3WW18_PTELU|nr:hypothetical protein [Pterocladia lucida]